jgi:NAD/NADP transhydrogenase alpha subunit
MRWLHQVLTPTFAFCAFFSGFYALLVSTSRADGILVAALAATVIGCAVGAFIVRKTRPNLALALSAVPSLLLFVTIALR